MMEELKSSTRVLLLSAVIMLIILITGPFGYKFGWVPLLPSLASLMVALFGAVLVIVAALIYVLIAVRNRQSRNRNMLVLSMVISLVPLFVVGPQILKARSVPPIHDISTDTDHPPAFDVLVKRRVHALNDLVYGTEEYPAQEHAALQREAYPDVQPLETELGVEEAVARAAEVLKDQGLEIVAVNPGKGLVEATATTFWFGFKDDVVVRVTGTQTGSRVDIRSVSRVGQSDIGANAERIRKFLSGF